VRVPGTERRRADRRAGPTVFRSHPIERRGRSGSGPELSVERRLFGLIRPYRRQAAAGIGVTLAMTLLGLAQPWPVKILIDNVFGPHSILGLERDGALALSVGLTMVIFLLAGSLGLLQTHLLIGLSQSLVQNLRREVFAHLTRVPLRYHDQRTAADGVYRIANDTYAVQSILLDALVPLSSALLMLGGTIVVMILLDPFLALLSLASVPLAALVTHRFTARVRRESLDLRDREAGVYEHAEQTLAAIRTVQAFGRERFELTRFIDRAGASRESMLRLTRTQVLFGFAVDLVLSVGLGLVTWVAAKHALAGQLTPGEVLVFLAYAGSLYGPVAGLASLVRELQQSAAAAQRVFEALDEPWLDRGDEHEPPVDRVEGRLAIREVSFAYSEEQEVLHSVSLEIERGQMVALVGPTGAGKSTIASLVLRLNDPVEGSVELDGIDLRELPLDWLREQIAYIPQEPTLFHASVRENIRYGRLDATDEEVEQAAAAANVLDELVADSRGLDTPLGDRGVTLSSGQRQRVAIARAMLKDAPIVIMDEPTSALDAVTEQAVMESFDRLLEGRTALVIAHRLATVRTADRIYVVQDGRIEQSGRHDELLGEGGLYGRLHSARFGGTEPPPPPLYADEEDAPMLAATSNPG